MTVRRLIPLLFAGLMIVGVTLASRVVATTTKITLSPANPKVTADQTVTFVVTAVDSSGTSQDVTGQSTLSTNDPSGSMNGAVYTAGQSGTWQIQASYQSFTTSTNVRVSSGTVAELQVNPNSNPEVILLGTTKHFTVRAFDADSNVIENPHVTWSVIGPIGTVTPTGVFMPTHLGMGTLQAQSGTVLGHVAIEVGPAAVTNTNSSTTNTNVHQVATNTNRPVVANTNVSTNNNVNTDSNNNTNETVSENTNVNMSEDLSAPTKCTTLKPWVWTLILVIFFILIAVLYGLVPVTKVWPVATALLGAGILAYVQRRYDCNLQSWWAWIITLGTVALTALAIRSNPVKPTQV